MSARAAARGSAQSRDFTAEVAFLTRALKAPTLREAVPRLVDRARAESWTHEEFLVACLQREVSARESHGGEGRIRAARFPSRKSLEEFDFDHARGLKRDLIAHLARWTSSPRRRTSCCSARPAPARPTSRPAWRSGPAKPAGSKTNSAAWAATPCSSSTRSATSRSNPKPRTCSSNSCPATAGIPASREASQMSWPSARKPAWEM